MLQPFDKPPLSLQDQLHRLFIHLPDADRSDLEWLLRRTGYYRLKEHLAALKSIDPPLSYGKLKASLDFDHALRATFLDCLEEVEIFFRATVNEQMIQATNDAFWYVNPAHFANLDEHSDLMNRIWHETRRSREDFVTTYLNRYSAPAYLQNLALPNSQMPPAWIMGEISSFGLFSRLFKLLKVEHRKKIAPYFGLKEKRAISWFHAVSVTRNICAHHSRFWNKPLSVTPSIPTRHYLFQSVRERSHASIILALFYLLHMGAGPDSCSTSNFATFILQIPKAYLHYMGFTCFSQTAAIVERSLSDGLAKI